LIVINKYFLGNCLGICHVLQVEHNEMTDKICLDSLQIFQCHSATQLSFSLELHGPKIVQNAQKAFLDGFTIEYNKHKFGVTTKWIHSGDLLAQFPLNVQQHLQGKLGN
jgi:hypothetical protein